jgi:hypothetical protein
MSASGRKRPVMSGTNRPEADTYQDMMNDVPRSRFRGRFMDTSQLFNRPLLMDGVTKF